MRYIKEFILVLIVIFAVNSIAAERKEVVVPDSIKAEDYARFITERVDRTAQYLVDHERKMPQMTIEKHQSAVDSLKYVFKLYRSDIEDLPTFNGSSKFRKSAIKTITDIIALLGDDFPDLHKAG